MKTNFFLLSICLFVTINLQAQDFAPVGAKWRFPDQLFNPPSSGVATIQSIGDSLINGLNCKHIYKENWSCLMDGGDFFIHESEDSINLYDALRDTFDTIIDFGAEVGDSWQFHYDHWRDGYFLDTIVCTIDSVFYHHVSPTDSLRTQDVTLVSLTEFYVDGADTIYDFRQARIYEKIGFRTALFPYFYPSQLACDANNEGRIRCYEDSIVGLLKFDTVDCDLIIPTDTEDLIKISDVEIFPNPTSDKLFFKTKTLDLQSVQVFSLEGKLMKEMSLDQPEINLSNLNAGIYFLKIKTDQGVVVEKVVVNRN